MIFIQNSSDDRSLKWRVGAVVAVVTTVNAATICTRKNCPFTLSELWTYWPGRCTPWTMSHWVPAPLRFSMSLGQRKLRNFSGGGASRIILFSWHACSSPTEACLLNEHTIRWQIQNDSALALTWCTRSQVLCLFHFFFFFFDIPWRIDSRPASYRAN